MDVKEKLVELLRNSPHLDIVKGYKGNDCTFEQGADWLIGHGVTVQEWIPVNDKLPNDREWVLVWHTGYDTPKKAKYKDDFAPFLPVFLIDGDNGNNGEVTHWQPMPQPPKGK